MARRCLGLAVALLVSPAWAQSLEGVRVGDNLIDVASRFGHPSDFEAEGEATVLAWDRDDGVRFSMAVLPESRRIVSVELSGNGPAPAVLGGLALGRTTLADIRKRFGSGGFTFADNARIERDGQVVAVTCYGLRARPDVVLAVITALPANGGAPEQGALHGVVLADGDYLKRSWGARGSADPDYKPIDLP